MSYYGDPGKPDFSGLWLGQMTGEPGVPFEPNRGPMDGRPGAYLSPWPLPYTPAYQKIFDDRRAAATKGRACTRPVTETNMWARKTVPAGRCSTTLRASGITAKRSTRAACRAFRSSRERRP